MSTGSFNIVVKGEPASKANSRKLVSFGGKPAFIKSDKALSYEKAFLWQCKRREAPLFPKGTDVEVEMTIYYASRRPDLDESLILDLLQKANIYQNDRQVRRKVISWGLDPNDPRSEIIIRVLA